MEYVYKQVRGKTVLIPSVAMVQQLLPATGLVDGKVLRVKLLANTDAALVCPVTLRQHLKQLGRSVIKN